MKLSQLIPRLAEMFEEHGDREVLQRDGTKVTCVESDNMPGLVLDSKVIVIR